MNLYTVWTKSGFGINEKCLIDDTGNYIGLELDENYYNIACKRIEEHKKSESA